MPEPRKQQPTLELVAERAGVSRATVSRVVNGSDKVKADVVRAVEKAIAELNYVPNRAARSLAQGRTNSIALVIPESTAKFFADPYFASVIQGAAMYLSTTEFTLSLLIATESDPAKTSRYLRGGNVDGALILSHHADDSSYSELAGSLPLVFGGRPMSNENGNVFVVDVDNAAAARKATEAMLKTGRKHPATISGPQNMGAAIDRQRGFEQAVQDAGLPAGSVAVGDFTPDSGESAMRELLASGAKIDSLFAASAQMAFGAMKVIADAGLMVPSDIAIATIDDDSFARNASPALTTVAQNAEEQGAKMAEIVVQRINGESVPERIIMPTKLILRGSHGV
ncbi:LacI family DNA-binding transcriptional regulator [Glutamicibacter sp.]|uniref:LacI family DNA-binding transcriptional regulator n=1 Tax=Glutamicibacter sp. TaxID=1931995 RepID=UPI002B474AC6|nr:LacI family DNA-binding transcriptional regulator [Glutamicibacter sp.]HJX77862.1 LacI family DNA-binding transcriptional regulator [Glutamicibacter sp.]